MQITRHIGSSDRYEEDNVQHIKNRVCFVLELIHRKSLGIYAPFMTKNASTSRRVSGASPYRTKENSMLVVHYRSLSSSSRDVGLVASPIASLP